MYRLLGADGKTYESEVPGQSDLAAGYRPCGNCLRQKYMEYKRDPEKYKAKFGL